jgi:plastocyanin
MSDTMQRQRETTTTTWMRLARAAAITMVVWSAVLQITARTVIPPVLVIGIVFLVFTPFLRGERHRLGVALAAFTTLALAGNLPGIIDELAHPESAPAFILTLLSVVTALVAITAGLGVFLRWSTSPIRAIAISWAAVFVVGAIGSVAASATTESDLALAGDTVVVAEKVQFAPDAITVATGSTGVWVENKDGIRHTLTIEELGVDLDIPALKARRVDFAAAAAGTYTYTCTVPGHENMTGTLVVEG